MNNEFCTICRKNLDESAYDYYHCSFFCERVEYYRYKYKVSPQPIVLLNNYNRNRLEMIAREQAAISELFSSKKTKQISLL